VSVRERGRRKRGKRKEKSKEGKSVCELCISFYFCCCFVKVTVERNVQIRAPKKKKLKKWVMLFVQRDSAQPVQEAGA